MEWDKFDSNQIPATTLTGPIVGTSSLKSAQAPSELMRYFRHPAEAPKTAGRLHLRPLTGGYARGGRREEEGENYSVGENMSGQYDGGVEN